MTAAEIRHRTADGWQSVRTFYRNLVRDIAFTFGMLDDKGNPSLTKAFSVGCLIAGTHGRLFHDQAMTWVDFSALALGAFATLGKAGMEMFRDWKQVNVQGSENISADLAKIIEARRDPARQIEPTP